MRLEYIQSGFKKRLSYPIFVLYFPMIQKGMTFDHDSGYSFPLSSSLLKKEGRIKGEWTAKIVILSHAFLDHLLSENPISKSDRFDFFAIKKFSRLFDI